MSKTKKIVLISVLLAVLLLVSFGAGYIVGFRTQTSSGLSTVDQAWNIVFGHYVDKTKLDAAALSQAAIKGMLQELGDPHTEYIDAKAYSLVTSNFSGTFEGIGAAVAAKDNQIIIIAPLPDSPAIKDGIKAGDVILEIDGQPTAAMSLEEAVARIRGPKGTSVSLLVLHQGESTPVKLDIVRAEINQSSVDFEMKDNIAYIRIIQFTERTNDELTPVIQGLANNGAIGIILDLRSNAGGILTTVVDVASHFLKEGLVTDAVDNNGKHTTYSVKQGEVTTDLPMVVLVDGYSASGSEVLAGALQDYHRATIAGTKTFGKGSVNVLYQLNDGSGIYLTIGLWFTPNGRLIEGKGLDPDIELIVTGDDAVEWAIDYIESKNHVLLPVTIEPGALVNSCAMEFELLVRIICRAEGGLRCEPEQWIEFQSV